MVHLQNNHLAECLEELMRLATELNKLLSFKL